jgi:hypothetical protein
MRASLYSLGLNRPRCMIVLSSNSHVFFASHISLCWCIKLCLVHLCEGSAWLDCANSRSPPQEPGGVQHNSVLSPGVRPSRLIGLSGEGVGHRCVHARAPPSSIAMFAHARYSSVFRRRGLQLISFEKSIDSAWVASYGSSPKCASMVRFNLTVNERGGGCLWTDGWTSDRPRCAFDFTFRRCSRRLHSKGF